MEGKRNEFGYESWPDRGRSDYVGNDTWPDKRPSSAVCTGVLCGERVSMLYLTAVCAVRVCARLVRSRVFRFDLNNRFTCIYV